MGPMPARNLSLLPSTDQFLGGMLVGDLRRPPGPLYRRPPCSLLWRNFLHVGGEVGSSSCSGTEVLAGTEEADPGRPPPTFGKTRIILMLTISAKPTMSRDDPVTKYRNKVLTRTPRSWTKNRSTSHSLVKFLIGQEAERILFSYPTKTNSSLVRWGRTSIAATCNGYGGICWLQPTLDAQGQWGA
ncbi:hypothetical protein B296_00038400 [Ensete ventricosum]|uniref:Uncharacterized protein n=1 Tax=Ensete ventricosum TaxID=4639 RepID=A0A426XDT8_ENSVE|nr:hypothetical protein B296_00038400 [Ensete ventricosum]